MIVHPTNWNSIGQPVSLSRMECAIVSTLSDIDCDCLSFSGGVDSSLLLAYLLRLGRKVRVFTVACDLNHPDIEYSGRVLAYFMDKFKVNIESHSKVLNGITGDDLVHAFYSDVVQWTDSMIAGDGVDEFMCGYYQHQANPTEETYFDFLYRLQREQLEPLNKNSGKVKVYLPYLDNRVTSLLWQIPISEKVDSQERKKITNQLARMAGVPDFVIERRKYGFCTVP